MAKDIKKGLGRGLPDLFNNSESQIKEESTVSPFISTNNSKSENVSRETKKKESDFKENIVDEDPRVIIRENKRINSGNKEKSEDFPREVLKETTNYIEIETSLIEPNPDQPRTSFDEEKLQELAHSIKDQGVLQPLVVRKKNDKYQIIAGERRWQASRIAGVKKVPCIIKEVDDNKALELALIENIQRDDLNPIEEAYTYKRLMDKLNYTQAELAKAVAKGRSTIANAIRLLDLPEEAQEAMFNNKITAGHARAVLSIPSPSGRKKLTEKIIEDKLSVRDAESLARLLSINTSNITTKRGNNIPPAYTAMAKSLREVLGTQVKVKKGNENNKLEITFKSEEELRNIYDKLVEE